jgi:hypothetical protein
MRALPNADLESPRFENGKPLVIAGVAQRYSGTNAGIPGQWQRFMPQTCVLDLRRMAAAVWS